MKVSNHDTVKRTISTSYPHQARHLAYLPLSRLQLPLKHHRPAVCWALYNCLLNLHVAPALIAAVTRSGLRGQHVNLEQLRPPSHHKVSRSAQPNRTLSRHSTSPAQCSSVISVHPSVSVGSFWIIGSSSQAVINFAITINYVDVRVSPLNFFL